jgi:hypothetical protein
MSGPDTGILAGETDFIRKRPVPRIVAGAFALIVARDALIPLCEIAVYIPHGDVDVLTPVYPRAAPIELGRLVTVRPAGGLRRDICHQRISRGIALPPFFSRHGLAE